MTQILSGFMFISIFINISSVNVDFDLSTFNIHVPFQSPISDYATHLKQLCHVSCIGLFAKHQTRIERNNNEQMNSNQIFMM